jgi:hypothetical protein
MTTSPSNTSRKAFSIPGRGSKIYLCRSVAVNHVISITMKHMHRLVLRRSALILGGTKIYTKIGGRAENSAGTMLKMIALLLLLAHEMWGLAWPTIIPPVRRIR